MKLAILGTGMVGQAIGSKLVQLGHEIKMGSRTANNPKAVDWVKSNGARASQGTFSDAAAFGEIILTAHRALLHWRHCVWQAKKISTEKF